MSECLLPNDEISIDDQRNISEIRNKMSDIPSSYSSDNANTSKCACGEKEDMEHIHNFRYLNVLYIVIFWQLLKIGNFEGTFAT